MLNSEEAPFACPLTQWDNQRSGAAEQLAELLAVIVWTILCMSYQKVLLACIPLLFPMCPAVLQLITHVKACDSQATGGVPQVCSQALDMLHQPV